MTTAYYLLICKNEDLIPKETALAGYLRKYGYSVITDRGDDGSFSYIERSAENIIKSDVFLLCFDEGSAKELLHYSDQIAFAKKQGKVIIACFISRDKTYGVSDVKIFASEELQGVHPLVTNSFGFLRDSVFEVRRMLGASAEKEETPAAAKPQKETSLDDDIETILADLPVSVAGSTASKKSSAWEHASAGKGIRRFCNCCGSELRDGIVFCTICGAKADHGSPFAPTPQQASAPQYSFSSAAPQTAGYASTSGPHYKAVKKAGPRFPVLKIAAAFLGIAALSLAVFLIWKGIGYIKSISLSANFGMVLAAAQFVVLAALAGFGFKRMNVLQKRFSSIEEEKKRQDAEIRSLKRQLEQHRQTVQESMKKMNRMYGQIESEKNDILTNIETLKENIEKTALLADPYVFISYCHRSPTDEVQNLIQHLNKMGIPVWYDTRLTGGSSFNDEIACRIRYCDCFISVMDNNYMSSEYCKDELFYARSRQKGILPIFLEETKLTPGIEMRLSQQIHPISKFSYPDEASFFAELGKSKYLQGLLLKNKKN